MTRFQLILFICIPLYSSSGLLAGGNSFDEFRPIFNGKNLDGWISDQRKSTKGYIVKDGAIHSQDKSGNLYSEQAYENYILRLEFKLEPGANNGIGLRAPLHGNVDGHDVAYNNFELQVLDDTHQKYNDLKAYQYHGSAYGIAPAKRGHLKPTGQWNQQEITYVDTLLMVKLNGTIILEKDLATVRPDRKKRPYAKGLFRARGHITFAGHGPGVAYRNIQIKPLPTNKMHQSSVQNPPKGFAAIFNGNDLEGWIQQAKGWRVENGTIHFSGKGKNLKFHKNLQDFEVYIDWKIAKGSDSGIYLRGKPQVQIFDATHEPDFRHGANKGSGGLWNNKGKGSGKFPLVKADRPVGQWNTFFIRMIDNRVTVYLNDQLVVNDKVLQDYKQRDQPIPSTGPLELQSHGTQLWFRHIFLRELNPKTTNLSHN